MNINNPNIALIDRMEHCAGMLARQLSAPASAELMREARQRIVELEQDLYEPAEDTRLRITDLPINDHDLAVVVGHDKRAVIISGVRDDASVVGTLLMLAASRCDDDTLRAHLAMLGKHGRIV